MPGNKQGSRGRGRASGSSTLEPFASYDPATSSWRTLQPSLIEDSPAYSGRWPRSGTMRNGVCYPQPTLVRPTDASASGSWPTPNSSDYKGAMSVEACKTWEFRGTNLPEAAVTWSTPTVDDSSNITRDTEFSKSLARDTYQWATPTASEDAAGVSTGMQEMLTHQAKWFHGGKPSPSEAQTAPSDSSPAKPRKAGLNPRFGLYLMGFPVAWLNSVLSAMPSSRSARSKSSAPSQTERED